MITITTLAQLAEALADGLRLEDPNQRGRGLSETEALELIGAGAQLIILGEVDHREVPRKHGRSGALDDFSIFEALVRPMLPELPPNWLAMHAINHCKLPINADRLLYPTGTPDATRPGELIDFKTTFESPRCVSYSTVRGSKRASWLDVFDTGVNVQHHAIERNEFAIRLALIPPSRS